FFSSRRRHTRWPRDWSSDVCSSDLTIASERPQSGHPVLFSSRHPEELKELVAGLGSLARNGTVSEAISFGNVIFLAVPYGAYPRSEERRVGKECISRLRLYDVISET